jgi:hypothetical protein
VVDVVVVQRTRVRDDEAQAVAAVIAGILDVGWPNHIIFWGLRTIPSVLYLDPKHQHSKPHSGWLFPAIAGTS